MSLSEIKRSSWNTLRPLISKINPALTKIIDQLDVSKEYPLYLSNYPYGTTISKKGSFYIPNTKGEFVSIEHDSISHKTKNELNYSGTIPLGVIIENGIESFLESNSRIIPGTFKTEGEFVSLWRILEEEKSSYHLSWTITSGARSICILPKITDSSNHKSLKIKYGLGHTVPQELFDHWKQLVHIANQKNFGTLWHSKIIFFSRQWLEHRKDKVWNEFYQFLFKEFWKSSYFRRNQFMFDSAFSIAQENKNLKPNPYLADTVRHLIAIGNGTAPGFATAINDKAAPVSGLQKVYLEDYGLKKYAPVIMHLHHFRQNEKRPVYYSFQMPTTSVFSPKSRKLSSTMVELHELKHIMESFISEILKGNIGLEKTPLYDLAKSISFNYYHSDKDKLGEISPANEIAKIDNTFTKSILDNKDYLFPEFAPFLRGCVSIS